MASKSKNVSVSKAELEETAVAAAVVAEDKIEEGLIEVSAGAQNLVAAKKVRHAGRAELAAGVSNVTHGVDQMIVADKLARLSEVVGAAGAMDVAEGIDALAASDDIAVQTEVVAALSAGDVARAMELGAVSGQLAVASDFVASRNMPVLAAFLEDKSNLLRKFAVDSAMRSGATRALAQAMSATGAKVGDLGVNEIAEGLVRMAVAEAGAERSQELAFEGEMNAIVGVEEIAAAEKARKVARKLEKQGIKQVAEGTEAVGQGEAIGAVAVAFDEAAQ